MDDEDESDAHYSNIEVEEKLTSALTPANIARLISIFRKQGCVWKAGMSGEDVINEVIIKVLSMERKWPKKMQAIPYLITTGGSIIDNESGKRKQQQYVDCIEGLIDDQKGQQEKISATVITSNQAAHAHLETAQSNSLISEWVNKIIVLFSGDADADCFIKQKLAGYAKNKIMKICNLSDQKYRVVEKRIKYKVRNKFPNCIPWWEFSE